MHALALFPVATLLWRRWTDLFWINPTQDMLDATGKSALNLLMASLACTPVQRWLGLNRILLWRRPLGLYAFAYGTLHLWVFVAIDYRFNFRLILDDVHLKLYIFAGLGALLLLLPLAVTSSPEWMRSLGKNWKRLHRLVYPAALLAILHFLWLSKTRDEPLRYLAALGVLFALRLLPRRARARAGSPRPGSPR